MQKRQFLTTAAAFGLFGYVALGMPSFGQAPPNLSSERLTGAELAADPGTLVVDIRTPGEWADTGVIAGALLVTYDDAESFLRQITPHLAPGETLALVCRSGNRTSRAARQIAPLIDTPVVDVAGGMNRILREGYVPVAALSNQVSNGPPGMGLESEHEAHAVFLIRDAGGIEVFSHYAAA